MGELTMKKNVKKEENGKKTPADAAQKRYFNVRTCLGLSMLFIVVAVAVILVANQRLTLSRNQLFATNRTRIQTVLAGLDAGVTSQDDLRDEYDQLYIAKLRNTEFLYGGSLEAVTPDDAFCQAAAAYAGVTGAAVIDKAGNTLGAWQCNYDFTIRRFAMLRACKAGDGLSEPFTVAYPEGSRRFFGKSMGEDRILVFAQDWTETEQNIQNMTSWEAVMRSMISVDTVSIAVSLQDYSFLYNPIDNLTGRDALQNGMPIDCLNGDYEGELTMGGETWCTVGRTWHDAAVFVMTKMDTDLVNDLILILSLSAIFVIFIGLLSAYGIIINQDNIRIGKVPDSVPLLWKKDKDGQKKHLLCFNLTVAGKLLPITLLGVLAVTGVSFYLQSVNSLSAIAYESNMTIGEIDRELENNIENARDVNTEYKNMFLSKCVQIADILENNPEAVLTMNPEDENVHRQPLMKDAEGNPLPDALSASRHPFLQTLCDVNAVERISFFDEYGRILATNGDDWYFVVSGDPGSQSYPFWEILADHRDLCAQDLAVDDEGNYAQYIGSKCMYYTTRQPDGTVAFVSKQDYQAQLEGEWTGAPIERHRGMVQISIAPERLRSVLQTATLTYVAGHTTVHGTGHTVICDDSPEHLCIYSPRTADIGRPAAALGYSAAAFPEGSEMYNGFETVDGEKYFQTFKRSGDSGNFVGTAVPLSTVYATRNTMTLTALILSAASFLIVFIYTCVFGSVEEDLYRQNAADVERRARNEQDLITITMPSGKKRRVRSAASRWDAEYVPWQQKTPEQKFAMIVKIVFYVFADLLFLCILLSRAGVLNINMINYVYEGVWRKGFNIFAMTNGLITLIVVFVVANLTEMLIDNVCVNIGSRAETLGHLFSSVIHYGVALFAVFYTLYLCGLDTGSLIASAGIMSLVIGLGAQSMIQDILAGVFIVFEGAFRVGDIVTIGDFRGNVMEIGLRTTKIEDTAKNIKVFNNSTLSGIINMTKETSVAAIDVSVAYGESLEHVEEVLAEELPKVRSRVKTILDGPYYKGVSGLSGSSVDLKIIAMCKEQSRLQLCRDLNRELLLIFNRNNINIPFPQVTVSYLDKAPSPEELQDARRFVAEQKEKERHGKD